MDFWDDPSWYDSEYGGYDNVAFDSGYIDDSYLQPYDYSNWDTGYSDWASNDSPIWNALSDYASLPTASLGDFYRDALAPYSNLSLASYAPDFAGTNFLTLTDQELGSIPSRGATSDPATYKMSLLDQGYDPLTARMAADRMEEVQAEAEALLSAGPQMSYAPWAIKDMMQNREYSPSSSFVLPNGQVVGDPESTPGAMQNPYEYFSRKIYDPTGKPVDQTFIGDVESRGIAGYMGDNGKDYYYENLPPEFIEDLSYAYPGYFGKYGGTDSPLKAAAQRAWEGAAKVAAPAASKTAKQVVDPRTGRIVGQEERRPSTTQGVLNAVLMALKAAGAFTKKDGVEVKKRGSTVDETTPEYVNQPNLRTLYMKDGGKVPERGALITITKRLVEEGKRRGLISGDDAGQEDTIDAKLSPGEYIVDAEVVSALGDGNTAAGAKKLDEMRYNVRKHKRTGGLSSIPKKAKDVSKYMGSK